MNDDVISWIKDCRDILYALSNRENDSLGVDAEGLGQASVALLEKLENVSPVFKDEPFTDEFKRSAIADTEFSIYWNQDPDKFNGTFTDPVEALAAMTAFIGTLSREAPEEQTSYVLNEMQETAKDLHAAGVMTEQTMEKFQEPAQDTKEAWWNGARAALGLPFDTPRSEVSGNFLSKPKPSLEDFLNALHESVELSSTNELKDAIKLIIEVQAMDSGMRDCIRAAFLDGPLDDGDVPCKSTRDELLENDYISKVVVKGEEGFNALTYKGARAYRLIKAGA